MISTNAKSQRSLRIEPSRAWRSCGLLCSAVLWAASATSASADPHYIENLTFSDRSPGSPRANSFEPTLRLDANDESFASAAGWEGGFSSWQKQFDHSKTLAADRSYAGLVFIGDSLTQNWGRGGGRKVRSDGGAAWFAPDVNYAQYGALNFGIAGDQTQNLIYRVKNGQLDGLDPGLIVLMVGTNNRFAPTGNPGFPAADYVGPAHTAEEIADGILAAVQAIHVAAPSANVLALSALRGLNNSDPDRIAITSANSLVAQAFEADEDPKLHYLDITGAFRNADGTINGRMNGDGIHLSESGYAAWAQAIEPLVSQYAVRPAAAFAPNVAPLGIATWKNSVNGLFGYYAQAAIDGDLETMNHGDSNGSAGGQSAVPDVLTIELDKTYDLQSIEIVNRGSLDGGSATSDARLNGVRLEVLGENPLDVRFSATLADVPGELGETLSFNNEGKTIEGARFIRLTSNGFLHVREVRANAVSIVPEPASTHVLGATVLGLCLFHRLESSATLPQVAR
jgi:lysophospholipase L1-like esterase